MRSEPNTKQKLEQEIVQAYPHMFPDYGKPLHTMNSFQIGEGWMTLVKNLVEEISQHQDSTPECEPVQFVQIKEKFGELRVYTHGGDDQVDYMIAQAETASRTVCEVCGLPGSVRKDLMWLAALCDAHYEERKHRS